MITVVIQVAPSALRTLEIFSITVTCIGFMVSSTFSADRPIAVTFFLAFILYVAVALTEFAYFHIVVVVDLIVSIRSVDLVIVLIDGIPDFGRTF